MLTSITPSLPAESQAQLESLLVTLAGVSTSFQIDLVDGIYATPASWPFQEAAPLAALQQLVAVWGNTYALELDAMIETPASLWPIMETNMVSRLIVHLGSFDEILPFVNHAQTFDYQLVLGVTNDVPLPIVQDFLQRHPLLGIQLMGIAVVGKQGQPFDERTLERVQALRASYPNLDLGVDGAVNFDTIKNLLNAGANRFAPGSVISKASNANLVYEQLTTIIR